MAATKNHEQFVTHAHIMLIGFLLSFSYGLCHKLWLSQPIGLMAKPQFYIHMAGAFVVSTGLFLLYGKFIALETIDPILALGSILVLIAAILMLVLILRSGKNA